MNQNISFLHLRSYCSHETDKGQSLGVSLDRLHNGLSPFQTLVLPLSPQLQMIPALNRGRRFTKTASGLRREFGIDNNRRHSPSSQLRLGFLSSDFGEHPVGHAIFHWFKTLQNQSQLFCYASDANERSHAGTELRSQIASFCHRFVDVTDLSDEQLALLIARDRVDVLINLVGHTAGARDIVFALRPSSVQALHYGYPGSTGMNEIDYVVGDRFASPPRYAHTDFTEKLVILPHSYFISAHIHRYGYSVSSVYHPSADSFKQKRKEIGLPPDAFVLSNFNQLYKLDPNTMRTWGSMMTMNPRAHIWQTLISVRKMSSLW